MTCILDFCRHLVCISMAMCTPPPLQHHQEPSSYWRNWKFWGHFRVIRKVPRTWGTEYRGQKSKVGTITVYVYKGKKRKKKRKKKEGTKLTSNSEYWVQGPKAKSGDDNSICIQRNKRKKRGDQIELKLRVLSTRAKIKSGDDNSIYIYWGKKKRKEKRGPSWAQTQGTEYRGQN
jgi:hypothetical protein